MTTTHKHPIGGGVTQPFSMLGDGSGRCTWRDCPTTSERRKTKLLPAVRVSLTAQQAAALIEAGNNMVDLCDMSATQRSSTKSGAEKLRAELARQGTEVTWPW